MASTSENHLSSIISVPKDELLSNNELQDKRLWIGNLDPRISEGYAFCTYKKTEDAVTALQYLDGQVVGSKTIVVRWAHSMSKDEIESKPKAELSIPVLAGAKPTKVEKKPVSRKTAIKAIEAKLKLMEQKNIIEEFEINNSPAALKSKCHVLSQAQVGLDHTGRASLSRPCGRRHDRKPYNRGRQHR